MNCTCPSCGVEFPWEAGYADSDGKRFAALLAQLESLVGRALVAYLRLFKPIKHQLRLQRAAALAHSAIQLMEAPQVERKGEIHSIPRECWVEAMDYLVGKRDDPTFRLPLESHNFLVSVAAALATRATRQEMARPLAHQPAARQTKPEMTPERRAAADEAMKAAMAQVGITPRSMPT